MAIIADHITRELDAGRALLIEWTTRSNFLRNVFCTRWKRLTAGISIALLIQLTLAIYFPIQVLVIGPMILGAPHLIASLRHGLGSSPKLIFSHHRDRVLISSGLWFLVIILRLMEPNIAYFWPEITAMGILTIIWLPIVKSSFLNMFFLITSISLLTATTIIFPLGSLAFLVLFHHFVAFFHWIKAATTHHEKYVARIALIIFTILHGFIFIGSFDQWIGGSEWASVPTELLVSTFQGWTQEPMIGMRCLVAYAFGQSIHYILWLKFIPEQQHNAQIPTSFRQSLRLLSEDFSKLGTKFIFLFIVLILGLAFFCTGIEFRWLYFSIASLHGFYEIFGLFLKFKTV